MDFEQINWKFSDYYFLNHKWSLVNKKQHNYYSKKYLIVRVLYFLRPLISLLLIFLGEGSFCDTCGQFHPNVHRLKKHHDAHHRQIKCKTCGK